MTERAAPKPQRSERQLAELNELLHAALPGSVAASLLVAAVFAPVQAMGVPTRHVVVWFVAFALVLLVRLLSARAYRDRSGDAASDPARFHRRFVIGAIAAGVMWGLAGWFLFPVQIRHQAFLGFILSGVCAGAVTTLAPSPAALLGFLTFALTPLSVRLLVSAGPVPTAMGVLAIAFLAFMAFSGLRIGRSLNDNIRLRLAESARKEKARRQSEESQRNLVALQRLHSITSSVEHDLDEKIEGILDLGLEVFGATLGTVTEIDEGASTIRHSRGGGEAQTDMDTPIVVDGQRYGTLAFSSAAPRSEPFSETDRALVRIFAEWIGFELSRSRVQLQLSESLAIRDAILDAATYSIIATDPDGVIRIFSRGAERMLGYTAEELVGTRTPAILHERAEVAKRAAELTEELGRPVAPGFDVFVAQARELDVADEREWTYIRKDGSRLPVLLSVTAVRDDEGDLLGYLGVAADLTERKRVDRLKNEFVSTVSHELRTPLTSIRGSLGLVAAGATGELPERARDLVSIAARNSERLILLINDILDMEKIESGRMDFSLRPQELAPLVSQAVQAVEPFAREHGVRLAVDGDLAGHRVCVDENRVIQILTNLLSNAAKFSTEGEVVRVVTEASDGRLRVAVVDHGPGIPEEFQPRIFQKFSQADASDRRRKGGTGLGLSISRALAEQMDGRIWFETEPGTGSTFFVEFPEWREDPDGQPAPEIGREGPKAAGDRGRVLVCEADPDAGAAVVDMLERAGYTAIHVATLGAVKAGLGQAPRPDALLLDLGATDGSTASLLRWIRDNEATTDLPVIALVARLEDGDLTLGVDVPLAGWLEKPVREQELVTLIARIAAGHADGGLPKVLHVEDDADLRRTVAELGRDVARFVPADTLGEAREALLSQEIDLVLLDLGLPDGSGWELLPVLRRLERRPAVVIFSASQVGADDARHVEGALLKSRTGEGELLKTLARLLGRDVPPTTE